MEKELIIGVVGLGYVGLPLACLFAKKYAVVGFDTNKEKVDKLNHGEDETGEVEHSILMERLNTNLQLTDDLENLRVCNVYVICVPTPVDENNVPDLAALKAASATVGKLLKKEDVVIYESSVFPGCTENHCVPVLSDVSGLEYNKDYFVGYSPERINPGDKEHTVENITKVVSGSTPETMKLVSDLYGSVLKNGVCKATSIKVAEAVKIVENTQRDVNIAFMNELCTIFRVMDINIAEVLKCAATKWNFVNVKPGLVGGHCIGVDPYYLIHEAWNHKIYPKLIMESRIVNENMGRYIAGELVKSMISRDIHVVGSKILILGFAFKANCSDIRNTKVVDVYNHLHEYTDTVWIYDPLVDKKEVERHYGISLLDDLEAHESTFDAIILCVSHKDFLSINFRPMLTSQGVLFDAMNVLPNADNYL